MEGIVAIVIVIGIGITRGSEEELVLGMYGFKFARPTAAQPLSILGHSGLLYQDKII